VRNGQYECFLSEDTTLPMLFMPDAIQATIRLMEADRSKLTIHSSYNLGGMSITPARLHREIKKHIPAFTVRYNPDFRQAIADTWPHSVDDTIARVDWGFEQTYDLEKMTGIMLKEVRNKLKP
jgi:nucleoside-diphosphate-sugar epimerase